MSLAFLVTSFIVCAAPGAGVLFTLGAGLSRGARASVVAAFGCTLGIVPHMLAAVFGLAAVLHASATAFQAFKYLGVAYLLFMAWNASREHGPMKIDERSGVHSDGRTIFAAIAVNSLNPKLSIFFLAFLPQFVGAAEPNAVAHMLELSAVFMAMTFIVFVGYGLSAAAVRDHVIARPRVMAWIRRGFAGAFVALGAKLALAER